MSSWRCRWSTVVCSLAAGVCFSGLHIARELRLTLQEGPVVSRGSPLVYARAPHIQRAHTKPHVSSVHTGKPLKFWTFETCFDTRQGSRWESDARMKIGERPLILVRHRGRGRLGD